MVLRWLAWAAGLAAVTAGLTLGNNPLSADQSVTATSHSTRYRGLTFTSPLPHPLPPAPTPRSHAARARARRARVQAALMPVVKGLWTPSFACLNGSLDLLVPVLAPRPEPLISVI